MEHNNMHENSPHKRVHYADNDQDDNAIERENYSAISEVSKSSVKNTGDANSEISIGTSILDVEEQDIRSLKKKLEDYEYKIKYLENENQVTIADHNVDEHLEDLTVQKIRQNEALFKSNNFSLTNERQRTSKLEKKLQFVKDNQEVFMRLKEAYINMKYNEAAGRKMIEIREKAVQTWQGIICSSCAESEELRRQIDIMIQKYSELFVISPGEMEHLINTVKYLKDLIDRREKSWAFNMDRENKLQNHIIILENENLKLKDLLAKRDLNIEDAAKALIAKDKLEKELLEERKVEEMQKFIESVTKDMEKLKKIIIKYEKKFREMKEKYPSRFLSPLNEKEMKIVQQLVFKYNAKFHEKSTEKLIETRNVSHDRTTAQSHRPASPLRTTSRSRDDSLTRAKTSDRPKSAKSFHGKAESAIMMMDCLFD